MITLRTLQHAKRISNRIKKSQAPTVGEIPDGEFEIRYISGKGLYLIANFQNKLYYLNFSETL